MEDGPRNQEENRHLRGNAQLVSHALAMYEALKRVDSMWEMPYGHIAVREFRGDLGQLIKSIETVPVSREEMLNEVVEDMVLSLGARKAVRSTRRKFEALPRATGQGSQRHAGAGMKVKTSSLPNGLDWAAFAGPARVPGSSLQRRGVGIPTNLPTGHRAAHPQRAKISRTIDHSGQCSPTSVTTTPMPKSTCSVTAVSWWRSAVLCGHAPCDTVDIPMELL